METASKNSFMFYNHLLIYLLQAYFTFMVIGFTIKLMKQSLNGKFTTQRNLEKSFNFFVLKTLPQ